MPLRRHISLLAYLLFLAASSVTPANAAQQDDFSKQVEANRNRANSTRADAARDVLDRVAKEKEQLKVRRAELEQWTKMQFEIGDREVIDKPKIIAPLLKRWQNQRENEIFRLLNFRDKSAGGIESGKALNTLLEQIGPAALENSEARKLNPLYGVPLYGPTAEMVIDEGILRRLEWQDGTLGAKSSGHFNQDPIDIDWPQVLQSEHFAENRHAIEEARDRLLDELRAKHGLTSELVQEMCEAVAELNKDYAAYSKAWIKNPPPVASRPEEYRLLCNGKKHIEKLINATYQVVDAKEIEDVSPAEKFTSGNIEQFLAYMQRNNLRSAPPTRNPNRTAYYQVFNLMARYYLDLKAVTNAEREVDQEIERLDTIESDAIQTALENKVIINLVGPDDVGVIRDLIAK